MRLQFALSVLPLLAVGQKTAQQSFKDLCPTDAKTSGITKLNGEQYNYYCNERWETYQKPSTKYDDPDACATYVSSQSGPTVMWMKNGACTVGSSTSRKDNTGVVCFEKVASSGGSTCCQERDDYKKQLSACQTLRDQYKQERDTCKSSASSGSGPSTGGTGSSRVFDCKLHFGSLPFWVVGRSSKTDSHHRQRCDGCSWSVRGKPIWLLLVGHLQHE